MSDATVNEKPIATLCLTIPAWGVWQADVDVADGAEISGQADLVVADMKLTGVVVPRRGGVYASRGKYRIVGGVGGWSKTVPEQGYRNDAGVETATLLKDVVALNGEKMASYPKGTVGIRWTRPSGPGQALLQRLSERAWYVDEQGFTHIGHRSSAALSGVWTVMDYEPDHDRFELASESIAAILPGVVIADKAFGLDGTGAPKSKTAGDVVHRISTMKDGAIQLRTTISAVASEATA